MTLKIENIRPDYDYHYDQYDSRNNWASDIYSLAATLKVWSDALQKALEISEK